MKKNYIPLIYNRYLKKKNSSPIIFGYPGPPHPSKKKNYSPLAQKPTYQ